MGRFPSTAVSKGGITSHDDELMRARATLTAEEEKKFLRKLDWYLLPLLSIMYAVKTIDAANVANARIMDQGTTRHIMTELHMNSD
ncbi:Major facilitator superfamily domain, general substrate transporter [Diplocarpon rosae]|nr:Major facilitator superfamily domain, general substrate transporter [Diplocarpon rosae]